MPDPSAPPKSSHEPAPPIAAAAQGAFDHGARSRFNAWFFATLDRQINAFSRAHKRSAFAGLQPGVVLEIGAGVGANLSYLPAGAELIALEPNLQMHDRLRRRCAAAGIELTLIAGVAEAIPLADASVDEVICSLTLCTVADPGRVLQEIRRVLRPGGRFRFVEHVKSPRRGPRRFVQRVIRRPWGWVFEGCDPGPATVTLLEEAGFRELRLEHRKLERSPFWPVNSAVWGLAVR
ncbi:MAG TPA: class I SAM-dependent methyltransferase [Solirubrobacteraceae bacterium]|nr:class I SAM-dependent methyltransferase [Solirubrobacteraceae bacterium]